MIYAIRNINDEMLISQSAWALSNMCRGHPLPSYDIIQDALPVLAELLARGQLQTNETIADCCWAIAYNIRS